MSVQRIAGRYAKSLIELAQEHHKLDRVLADVTSFQQVAQHKDFALMLKSPIVNAGKKLSIVEALFGSKYDELTLAFLRILINKGREPYLPEIASEFIAQYKKLNHISTVKVTTAEPLSIAALASLQKKLEASSFTDTKVEITTAVDQELIGGFVLEIGDRIYDASVQQKLDELKRSFQH
ncbi:MAG: ATP synthase F1 subunit delta [Bacteroidetes bacterium]|nr:MAG: ATP synthase F1 subunit delta [Bacteroidota bacterium]PTM11711.1 MAG: ATP synthase F1 subunit delta [Bacteroidota bacterium]